MTAKNKSFMKLIFRLITLMVLGFFLLLKYDWLVLWTNIQNADSKYLLLAVLISLSAQITSAYRWKLLCIPAKIREFLGVIFVGQFYATILPGQIFGETARIIYIHACMKKRCVQVHIEQLTASVVMDKLVGFIALFIVGIWGVVFAQSNDLPILWIFVTSVVLLVLALYAISLSSLKKIPEKYKIVTARWKWLGRFLVKFNGFLKSWRYYLKRPYCLLLSLLIGAVYQLLIAFSMYFLGKAIGFEVSLMNWSWVLAFLSVALLLPLSVAGIGIREASLVGTLALCGISSTDAMSASLLLLGIQLMNAGIGGICLLGGWRGKRRIGETTCT